MNSSDPPSAIGPTIVAYNTAIAPLVVTTSWREEPNNAYISNARGAAWRAASGLTPATWA
jgi:hypothetical protein